jgi:hypothetical protein
MNKTIKINPNLFDPKKASKGKKEKKDGKKQNITHKHLDHLKKQLIHSAKQSSQNSLAVKNTLNESMDFLSNKLTPKKKTWVEVNLDVPTDLYPQQQLPQVPQLPQTPLQLQQSQSQSHQSLTPSDSTVPYGCLKNGKKPTYRNYRKLLMTETRKNNQSIVESLENVKEQRMQERKTSAPLIHIDTALQEDLELNKKLKKEMAVLDELKPPDESNVKKTMIQKTVLKKYTLGKDENKKMVSVLIKNAERKNEVLNAKQDLQRTKMHEAKRYLIERNLLKKGSDAPNNVIMEMFKNARLAGDIHNVNFNSLLESFVNND